MKKLMIVVWSGNIKTAHLVARGIRSGLVHINSHNNDNIMTSFGG